MIVEDGTGLSTAQSYVSVADADAYHTAHGNATWTGVDALKEAALVRATQALDARYSWQGYRLVETQALDWPRYDAYDVDGYYLSGVPQGIKDALCEMALLELVTPGELTESVEVSVKREKVGPLETEYYEHPRTSYPAVENALRRIVRHTGGIQIVRRA